MKFYQVTSEVGGEDIWLRRISSLYREEPKLIWPRGKPSSIDAKTPFNRLILYFFNIMDKIVPGVGRGLFLNIFISLFKFEEKDIVFLSSTYIPIPRGKRIITYIHTPSRALTVDYESTEKNLSKKANFLKFILKVFRFIYKAVYKFSLNNATLLLVNSSNIQKRVENFSGKTALVCYPSQDTSSFYTKDSENYFLLVSKIQPYKGHDFCIKAFKLFCDQNPNFKLFIVSMVPKNPEDIDFYNKLKSYADKFNLPVEFRFDLSRKEVIELYSKAYLCLFGSKDEDLGQVPIEAMAASKPVVSINGSGPSETLVNGVTGFLVSTEIEMAEKMLLLASDSELAQKMGKNGRERAVSHFDDVVFKENLDTLIDRFLV